MIVTSMPGWPPSAFAALMPPNPPPTIRTDAMRRGCLEKGASVPRVARGHFPAAAAQIANRGDGVVEHGGVEIDRAGRGQMRELVSRYPLDAIAGPVENRTVVGELEP